MRERELARFHLLRHDVGGAAGGDAARRGGGVEVVEREVADGGSPRGVHVDSRVFLPGGAVFLERCCHIGIEKCPLGFSSAKKEKRIESVAVWCGVVWCDLVWFDLVWFGLEGEGYSPNNSVSRRVERETHATHNT